MVAAVQNRSFVVDVQCLRCRIVHSIILNKEDLVDWTSGDGYIQDIFHYLSTSERELLISNICGSCFDELFPPLDSDD